VAASATRYFADAVADSAAAAVAVAAASADATAAAEAAATEVRWTAARSSRVLVRTNRRLRTACCSHFFWGGPSQKRETTGVAAANAPTAMTEVPLLEVAPPRPRARPPLVGWRRVFPRPPGRARRPLLPWLLAYRRTARRRPTRAWRRLFKRRAARPPRRARLPTVRRSASCPPLRARRPTVGWRAATRPPRRARRTTVGRRAATRPPRRARLPTVGRRAARPPLRTRRPTVERRAARPPRRRPRPSLLRWRASRPRRRGWSTAWWQRTTLQNWTQGGGRAAAVALAVRQMRGDRVRPVAKQPPIIVVAPPLPLPLDPPPRGVGRLLLPDHGAGSSPFIDEQLPPGAETGHTSHLRQPAAAAGDGSRLHNQRAAAVHTADEQQPLTPSTSGSQPQQPETAAAHTADGRQPPTLPSSSSRPHHRPAAASHTTGARPPPTPPARGRRPHRRRAAAAHAAGPRSPLKPPARGRRPQHNTTGARTERARAPNALTRAPVWQLRRPPSAHWRGSRGHERRGGGAGEENQRGRRDGVEGSYRPRRGPQSESKSARKHERKPTLHRPLSRARPPKKRARNESARTTGSRVSDGCAGGGVTIQYKRGGCWAAGGGGKEAGVHHDGTPCERMPHHRRHRHIRTPPSGTPNRGVPRPRGAQD